MYMINSDLWLHSDRHEHLKAWVSLLMDSEVYHLLFSIISVSVILVSLQFHELM